MSISLRPAPRWQKVDSWEEVKKLMTTKNLPVLSRSASAMKEAIESQLQGRIDPSEVGNILRRVARIIAKYADPCGGEDFDAGWKACCFVLETIFDEAARGADIVAREDKGNVSSSGQKKKAPGGSVSRL